MAIDWSKPNNATLATDVLGLIREQIASALSMSNKVSDTNIPNNCLRLQGLVLSRHDDSVPSFDDFASLFPLDWETWTPTFGATGSMTYTGVTTNMNRYIQIGKTCFFSISATGTTGGTASNGLLFTLPVNAASSSDQYVIGSGWANQTVGSAYAFMNSSASQVRVARYDTSSYTLGASRAFAIFGMYRTV